MNDLRVSFPKPCSEQWDDMAPDGCNRHCERCEKTIYDLSALTLEEVEGLARSGEVCVRAEVGSGGEVRLSEGRGAHRMVAAIGTSVGIFAASTQAAAADGQKLGAIKGAATGSCGMGSVRATAADGQVYHAKIGINGRYKVKRLRPGPYEVRVEMIARPEVENGSAGPQDPELPNDKAVIVVAGRTSKLDLVDPNSCIVIGMLKIDDSNG